MLSQRSHLAPGTPPSATCLHGTGRVAATTDHAYADALSKGHRVTLLVQEQTGALSPTYDALLRRLGRVSVAPGTHDSTVYGLSRASPSTFYSHHVAAGARAVILADMADVLNAAATQSFELCAAPQS